MHPITPSQYAPSCAPWPCTTPTSALHLRRGGELLPACRAVAAGGAPPAPSLPFCVGVRPPPSDTCYSYPHTSPSHLLHMARLQPGVCGGMIKPRHESASAGPTARPLCAKGRQRWTQHDPIRHSRCSRPLGSCAAATAWPPASRRSGWRTGRAEHAGAECAGEWTAAGPLPAYRDAAGPRPGTDRRGDCRPEGRSGARVRPRQTGGRAVPERRGDMHR
jgi:hypothetical protein